MGDIENGLGTQSSQRSQSLRFWSLATFHTASFVATVVAVFHVSGSLQERLSHLDTPAGVLIFLALWALTWLVTKAALVKMSPPIDEAGSGSIVMSMTVAGGWNGVGIFAALFVIGPLWRLALHSPGPLALPGLLVIGVIGLLLAFTIGAIVGMCYGLVDALLLGCGEMLDRWARAGE